MGASCVGNTVSASACSATHKKQALTPFQIRRDEGEGSLFAVLRSQGWATGLCAGEAGTSFSAASFFMIHISLTDEGQRHALDVTSLVFRCGMVTTERLSLWLLIA